MASLFKPTYTKKDPQTGKTTTRKLAKWYVKYRDANGTLKRVAGFSDKAATKQLAAKLEREAELERVGIFDPFQKHRTRALAEHLNDFEASLGSNDNSAHHVRQVLDRVRRVINWCGFKFITDISASRVEAYLADLRSRGRSAQTSNHYLRAVKQFCRWLTLDGRTGDNPIAHLKLLNVKTDRRHDRRALDADAFERLLDAAAIGPDIESVSGSDRVMLYILAAWTGYRRRELASLTLRSFDLESDPPVVRVVAGYSKRRRQDEIPLHDVVVQRLQDWLLTKALGPDDLLFVLVTAKGHFRKTAKMMKLDLQAARETWIEDADDAEEKSRREQSDYLCYQDADGLFADFHSNRHTFISNLGRAGVSPKVAQMLARHSDINLTMNIYSHIELNDQAAAIRQLPAPPKRVGSQIQESSQERNVTTNGPKKLAT